MRLSKETYLKLKEKSIQGRYVTPKMVAKYLKENIDASIVNIVGTSVQNKPIQTVTLGKGEHKILMWSQMHGNESTTTKALLDLLNFFNSTSLDAKKLLANCTFKIILILNPDGAEAYTRVNANQIDLNRDAQELSQPESIVLRAVYNSFKPQFCFNLHDQRTIFNVGTTSKPATVSFLAPAHDQERTISSTRKSSMQLIAAMNKELQHFIPGQVGRYDDGFNANCVGDTFQMLHTPTILFESGHYSEDYERERTREYIFRALIIAIDNIATDTIDNHTKEEYFLIPENQKQFFDIIIHNAKIINTSYSSKIAILFKEVLVDGEVTFVPQLQEIENIENFYAHKTYNCLDGKDFKLLKKQQFWSELQSKY